MHYATLINNNIQLTSWYFKTIKMVRMQLELLTIDNRSVTTLKTPVRDMLRDDELQSACLKIATKLFESLCIESKAVVDTLPGIQSSDLHHINYAIPQVTVSIKLFDQI